MTAAFTSVTALGQNRKDKLKTVTFTAVGSALYDAGGSILDLSTAGGLGVTSGFKKRVDGVHMLGVSAHASSKWLCTYVPAAAGAPATGKLKVDLLIQATPAEEGATDMSGTTFTFVAFGE